MAEAQLRQFLDKVRQLNAFVALSEADPILRQELRDCAHHDEVVALARRCGFEIGRRWGEPPPTDSAGSVVAPGPQDDQQLFTPGPGASTAVVSGLLSGSESPCSLLMGSCPPPGEEHTDVLLQSELWRLERIHSCACSSPAGFWYEQGEEEWVMLLQGRAGLQFSDEPTERQLQPGDSVFIRAGRRHRVTATDPPPGTIWLALFWPTA